MTDGVENELHRLAGLRVRDDWNETDVREEVLAPLLRLLGYEKGTDYDINREEHLLLHPFLMRGSERVKVDYAVLVRRRHFWVMEAKRPSLSIEAAAMHQAYFYAIHPEVQARFFAVCNGREFGLYDVRHIDERYVPVLQFALSEIEQHFTRLRDVIGSGKIRDEVARRALADLRKVVETEIRGDRLNDLDRDLRALVTDARRAVEQNVRALKSSRWQQRDDELRAMITKDSPLQIARVAFEFVDTKHQFDLVFDTLRAKLKALPDDQYERAVRDLADLFGLDLPSATRLHVIQALLRLLPELEGPLAADVRERLRTEVRRVLLRFPADARPRLVWQLEGLLNRVPYKVSILRGDVTNMLESIVEKKKATLPETDLVAHPPSVWGERYVWSTQRASELFHQIVAAPTEKLAEVIAGLEKLEREVEERFQAATDFDGESTPPTFVYFDKYLDWYRSVLFHVLLAEFVQGAALIGDEELAAIEDLLRRVREDEYHLNHADAFWVRVVHARDGMDQPVDPESGEPLAADALRHLMSKPTFHRGGISAAVSGVRILGALGDGRFAEYPARLNLERRRVEVAAGTVRR